MKKKYKIKIYWKQIILIEFILAISFLIPYSISANGVESYGFPFAVIRVNKISNLINTDWNGFLFNVIFYIALVFLLNVIWIKIKKK